MDRYDVASLLGSLLGLGIAACVWLAVYSFFGSTGVVIGLLIMIIERLPKSGGA